MVLAIGAGGLYAAKRGRKALRQAVGWTAEKAGFITARMQETLAETRQVARQRYLEGRAATQEPADLAPTSSRPAAQEQAAPVKNGTHLPPPTRA